MKDTFLLFSKRSGWKDRFLRASSLSRWSGLDILLPGRAGDPVFVMGLDPETGFVSRAPLANRIVQVSAAGLLTVMGVAPERIIEAVSSQLDKPFDWRWLFPERLNLRRWRDKTAWYPAELMAWAFEEAGIHLFDGVRGKITLDQFWGMVDKPLIPVEREILRLQR